MARGLVLGSFAWAGCMVYDESLIARGNASGLGGPSTVFVTTGWNIGSGGSPVDDAGSSTGSGGNGGPWDGGTRHDDAWGGSSTDGDAGDTGRGRPAAITITGTIASSLAAPSTSGTGYFRSCGRDAVVIGYTGTVNLPEVNLNYLRSFQAICGSLAVVGTTTYTVQTLMSETLSQVGDTLGTLIQTALCPRNQIVVGFGVHSGSFIDSITFSCAPLEVSLAASGYTLSLGPKTTLPLIGGPRGMTFTEVDCPPGTVAVGHTGKAGRDINSFGLLCGSPTLVVE